MSSVRLTEAIGLAQSTYGCIDGLILNAGVLDPLGPVDSHPLDAWKTHFDVNFFSLITALKASLPSLRKQHGKVVFVSSGAATGGIAGWGPYNASKVRMPALNPANSMLLTLAAGCDE
jgi:NAD(P)-dependent dehydrogenase (short-subunit alcohol dehydrogenase family)